MAECRPGRRRRDWPLPPVVHGSEAEIAAAQAGRKKVEREQQEKKTKQKKKNKNKKRISWRATV